MKFWHKTYLCVLILFLIAFDVGGYLLTQNSYNMNKEANTNVGIREFQSATQMLEYTLSAYNYDTTKDSMPVILSFADGFMKKGAYMEFYEGENLIFSNFSIFHDPRGELKNDGINTVYRKIDDTLYLFTAGTLDNLKMVIIRDSNFLSEYSDSLIDYFVLISIIISIILSLLLIVLLKRLTQPFDKLNKTANEIASGNYQMRAEIRSHDEIGDFAKSFNKMAEAVSSHIDALKNSNAEKERFVNNLTHELRTPLAAVKGYSELLCKANCTESEKDLASAYIYEHATRLEKLMKKLMDLLYIKGQTISPQKIDVYTLFKRTAQFTKPNLVAKNIDLEAHIGIKEIIADETLIQTLLINLVENAIKASDNNAKIILKSCEPSTIEITDFGIGISKEDIDKITEDFYRVDKSRSRQSGGVGLGLSLCKQIIELHGGEMKIESVYGNFTTIKLIFTTNLQPCV